MDLSKMMDFSCGGDRWMAELDNYEWRLKVAKPLFVSIDSLYRNMIPQTVSQRKPLPFLTMAEFRRIVEWMKGRGLKSSELQDAVQSEEEVKLATQAAFQFLPNNLKAAMNCLTNVKGIGCTSASAILAVVAPGTAPYMSPEAHKAAMGWSGCKSLDDYFHFAEALQKKAKALNKEGENLTVSDLERALWISAVWSKCQKNLSKAAVIGMGLHEMMDFSCGDDRWKAELEDYERRLKEVKPAGFVSLDSSFRNDMPLAVSFYRKEGIVIDMDLSKMMDFSCGVDRWKAEFDNYEWRLKIAKPLFVSLDSFYRNEMPQTVSQRKPLPFLTMAEFRNTVQWMEGRGLKSSEFEEAVQSEEEVKLATQAAFQFLPNNLKAAMDCLTNVNGIGCTSASAILAVLAPGTAPYMSPEALSAMGWSGNKSLDDYVYFAKALQKKAKDLSDGGENFTVSDVERVLWISAVWSKELTRIAA